MRSIEATLRFFKEVVIAIKSIIREAKKAINKRKVADGPSKEYRALTAEIDSIAEYLTDNGERLGKIAHEMALAHGLIDKQGLVTPKAKKLGITSAQITPFNYTPTGLN